MTSGEICKKCGVMISLSLLIFSMEGAMELLCDKCKVEKIVHAPEEHHKYYLVDSTDSTLSASFLF